MREQVGDIVHEVGPPDRWHPVYDGIKDWLENEAPVSSPLVYDYLTKARNSKPRFRIVKRRA
jgi:hypothetical protein